jgi:hypothetical protein
MHQNYYPATRHRGHAPAILAITVLCVLLFGCSKKSEAPKQEPKTVLTGIYKIIGLYSINANATYTPLPTTECRESLTLELQDSRRMNVQSECLNFTGTWTYSGNILTITKGDGTLFMQGAVEFETDGITIDVNSTVDNLRYRLFRS